MANVVTLESASGKILGTFTTIQAAVNAAGNGDTILVGPGTYQEQVTVSGLTGLTIEGSGEGQTTILAPASLTNNITNNGPLETGDTITQTSALIGLENGASVTVKGLTVNGNDEGAGANLVGIEAVNSNLTVNDVHITGVEEILPGGYLAGSQGNRGIVATDTDGLAQSLTVTNSTIDSFQKEGIVAEGTGLTADISGNTITGYAGSAVSGFAPTGSATQNLILIYEGAIGSITLNHLSGIGNGPNGGVGILAYGAGNGLVVEGNIISSVPDSPNSAGIYFFDSGTGTTTLNVLTNLGNGLIDIGGPDLQEVLNLYSGDAQNYYLQATGPVGATILATGGSDFLEGAGNNAYVVIGGAPTNSTFVGTSISGGINVVEGYGGGSTLAIENGGWVVTGARGSTIDTLTGIEEVVINNTTYLLVDNFGQNVGGFQSLAAADKAAHPGDIIAEDVNGHVQLIGIHMI